MKKFKQLINELPSRKVVFAFGRFQPPTTGHELLVNAVKKIAEKQGADHFIFASKTQDKKQNPLPVDRKVYYLSRMFPKTNFVAADENIRTFIEAAKMFSGKYKHIIMVAGSDRVPNFKEVLEKYNGKTFNFDTIEVVSAGERDPDSDTATGMSGTKMREAAKKGDFASFKRGLPHTMTELDGKRLMNEIRQGLGIEAIKEHITFDRSTLREQYHAGKIFNIGDNVTDGESVYEIVDRGANYISVVNEHGDISKKWLDAVSPIDLQEDVLPGPVPEEITFKGYTTKNLHHSEDAVRAFTTTIERYNKGQITDPVAILNALKATDAYMKINDLHLEQGQSPDKEEVSSWLEAHNKARDSLNRIGEFMHHMDYWHTHEHEIQDLNTEYTPDTPELEFVDSFELTGDLLEMKYTASDKIKVARVIASALGLEDVEKSSNPEQLINASLRKIRSKQMRPEYADVVRKMLQTADEAGIEYDKKLVPAKTQVSEDVSNILHHAAVQKMMGIKDDSAKQKLRNARIGKDEKENESDQHADAAFKAPHSIVGHSLHNPDKESPAVRTMKIAYKEDVSTSEYAVKKYVDQSGETRERKVRPHHVTFKASKGNAEPNMKDVGEFKEEFPYISDVPAPNDNTIKNNVEESEEDFEELTDKDLDKLVGDVEDEEDILDAYDDEELALIDAETGEHVEDIKEEALNEVLSRIERIRAKARFAKTQSKRERRIQLALKSRSSSSTINSRARRLAIKLMKQRLARKPLTQLSIGEKERIDRAIEKRKAVINRLAMKLAPRVRKIENDRLSHSTFTK